MLKSFFRYVSQNMLGMLGLSCYILADTFFIANRMGSDGLAALNLSIPIYSIVNGIGLMLGIGGGTRYAVLKAQEQHEKCNRVYSISIGAAVAIGLVFITIGLLLSQGLAELFGGEGAVRVMTSQYLKTLLAFSPCFLLNNVMVAFLRNDGSSSLAMAGMLAGSMGNIGLDWIFLFHFNWGMAGAAFATGLAPVISMLVLSLHFIKGRNGFKPVKTKPDIRLLRRICQTGLSSMVSELAAAVALIVFNMLIIDIQGVIGVAAYGVVANLSLVAASLFTGIAQGIQPLVSRFHGRGEYKKAGEVFYTAVFLSLSLSACIYLLTLLFKSEIVCVFNNSGDAMLAVLAEKGLVLYFTGFFLAGVNIISASFFSSMERAAGGFAISFIRGFGGLIPAALLLASLFGMTGVWLSFPAAEGAALVLSLFLFVKWRKSLNIPVE